MKSYIYIRVFISVLILIFASCSDYVQPIEEDHGYTFFGGVVKNTDNNTTSAAIHFERDSVLYNQVRIDINGLAFGYDPLREKYIFQADSATALPAGQYTLNVEDSTWFDYSYTDSIPFNLAITSISLSEDRTNGGGTPVQLIWQMSPYSEGYLLAVTQKDSAYVGAGWITVVESGFNEATVLPDAFRLSGDLDTAWYYVYVYSFTGSPASDFGLPVSLPPGFIDNIDELAINGSFGAIVIAPRDSIHVTLQPF